MKNINAHISQRRIKLERGYKRRPESRNCSALEAGLEPPSVKNKRVCVSFTLIWCLRGICCIPSLIAWDYRSEFSTAMCGNRIYLNIKRIYYLCFFLIIASIKKYLAYRYTFSYLYYGQQELRNCANLNSGFGYAFHVLYR